MKHVLLSLNDASLYRQALERAGLGVQLAVDAVQPGETPGAEQLARTEILFATQLPAGVLAQMPKLRWIQAATVGIDNWLSRPDLRADIALTCARGTHRVQMPENILGALFHVTKPYAQATLDQREQRWVRRVAAPLAGKTLGILGLGAIGTELARKAAALELRVIGTRRSQQPVPHVAKVYPPQALDVVLGESDFVVLLLPLTAQTENIVNSRRLAAMRRSAYLLNFGRGGLIVDADLVAAVGAGTIAGAVLDVYRTEPLPAAHPFWTTPGITVLPHIGGLAEGRDDEVAALFSENARRYLAGEALAELVDRSRGY